MQLSDLSVLSQPAPAYPALSRRMGEEGRVMVRLLVDTSGRVDRAEVRASSGSSRLDQAALAAVRAWRFAPPRRDGEPVMAWVTVPIQFSLEG